MEFPGMANDQAISGKLMNDYYPSEGKTYTDFEAQFGLSLHEMCHMYFPFLMGINEKKYAWMDEGWATFSEYFIDGENDQGYTDIASATLATAPIISQTNTQPMTSFTNSYDMGALSYYSLYYMLGEDLFFKCLHSYMNQWKHKHPTPWDFFNCFNTASKMDLNWYWKAMYFDWGYADIAINKFEKGTLELQNLGRKPIAFTINITYTDDTKFKEIVSPAIWKTSDVYVYPIAGGKEIKFIEITTLSGADVDRTNNDWIKK
jgi:aminopeptidase N